MTDSIRRTASLVMIALVSVATPSAAEPPKELREITSDESRPGSGLPRPIPGTPHRLYYDDGALVANGSFGYGFVRFPPRAGAIVPIFGSVYQHKGRRFEWIKDADLPPDVAIRPDSIAIPLHDEGGYAMFGYRERKGDIIQSMRMFVKAIESPRPDDGKGPVARITQDVRDEGKPVRRGDLLKFGEDTFDVRNIVPEGKGIRGWVEIGPVTPKQRAAVIVRDKGMLKFKELDKPDNAEDTATRKKDDLRRAWISETLTDKKGRKWMQALWTHEPGTLDRARAKVDYPPLTSGDVLPVFGQIYRVKEVTSDAIEFEEIGPADLPRGVGPLHPRSAVIPLKSDRGVVMLNVWRLPGDGYEHLYLDWIEGADRAFPVMEVPHLSPDGVPMLRTGGGIEFATRLYTVRSVVPRDESRQIIGWAEVVHRRDQEPKDR